MKHKVADLEGALLDAVVARAEGIEFFGSWDENVGGDAIFTRELRDHGFERVRFAPSTSWADGGPIIERERITLESPDWGVPTQDWTATVGEFSATGLTPLVAAMRAYVASKLGEEVSL